MPRFPFGIPNSWYEVCYSDELAKGEVKTVHYLGRDIVLFRGHDGNVGALHVPRRLKDRRARRIELQDRKGWVQSRSPRRIKG